MCMGQSRRARVRWAALTHGTSNEVSIMSRERKADPRGRRAFLKGAVATGGGLAVAAVAPGAVAAAPHREKQEPVQTGYRLTPHVLRYYQTLKG